MKALANKQKVKQVTINKNSMFISYYDDVDLPTLMEKVDKYKHFKFEKGANPKISVDVRFFSVQSAIPYFIEFLSA